MNDVIINKAVTIERCIKRIEDVYQEVGNNLATDFTRQDSILLNLQRACEASIDLANYLSKQRKLGIPQRSRDSFNFLFKAGVIPEDLAMNLGKMVGLRNIAVHDYQELNLDIVKYVIEKHLVDFQAFVKLAKSLIADQD